MAAINNDWLEALKEEFKKPYYKQLFETVTGHILYSHLRMTFLMHFI